MIALRLVIDTNIVVSAALKPDGLQRTVLVLARPELKIRKGLRLQLLQLMKNRTHAVRPLRPLHVTPDADDNKFLECADAARADYLVTGNQRHFPAFWKRTKVITSRELVAIVAPHLG